MCGGDGGGGVSVPRVKGKERSREPHFQPAMLKRLLTVIAHEKETGTRLPETMRATSQSILV
jgi:hypothetical protein